ncbi:ABC transporter permease [Micromonospora inyonensis]|uniref:Peptide/nickel transport system permease protein n=1 Tax=Micromonospora inyonensis TaxID=47866 RepID=A0A1C6SEK0_9ACTN|nr:ABC transporter permease [Micromonospora inyonensis]SCL27749.1 peptide/nickel transport system permease protein [Micromonospora inyonensis]
MTGAVPGTPLPDVAPAAAEATPTGTPPPARRRRLRLWIPLGVIAAYLVAGVFGPMVARYDPIATSVTDRLLPPGSRLADGGLALLGTDQVGRDLLAQIMQGARVSMLVGAATLLIAGTIGSALGVLCGYRGGVVDTVVMRLADIQLAFPSILLAVFVAGVLGASVTNVVLTLSITTWPVFARVARAQTLATRSRDFANAARTLGAGPWHVVRHCVLPAVLSPVLVVATVQLGFVIVAEASLSFLSLGIPPGTPSWGTTIANGRDHLAGAWWIATLPGLVLALFVVCAGVLGDELRDRSDPNLSTR